MEIWILIINTLLIIIASFQISKKIKFLGKKLRLITETCLLMKEKIQFLTKQTISYRKILKKEKKKYV